MFKQLIAGVVMAAVVATSTFAQASRPGGSLKLGDAAPTLSTVEWIKGQPIPEWKSGHVYVLDFWATWCGPCIASIPHITELQKKYADQNVHVIGVAIWPRPGMKPTAGYVESRGEEMAYTIAEDIDGKMAEAFMESTSSNGIPTAMVIDKQGKLAWIGHPMAGLDAVVERVVSGSYSVDEEMQRVKAQEVERAKAQSLIRQFQDAQANSDWDNLIVVADKLLAMDASRYGQAGLAKYYVTLIEKKDPAKAAMVGRELVDGAFGKTPYGLNALAWLIADEEMIPDEQRDLDLALAAATKASELTKQSEPDILDTLALVHFKRGDVAAAVATQRKAVDLVDDEDAKEELREKLEEYQNAQKN